MCSINHVGAVFGRRGLQGQAQRKRRDWLLDAPSTDAAKTDMLADEETMHEHPFSDGQALADLCRRHHIRRLSLFGSTLKGAARPDSDVDLLVEFEPGREPGLIALAGIEAQFSALLGGRKADLRTAGDLSRHFRDEIVRTAEVQFAA